MARVIDISSTTYVKALILVGAMWLVWTTREALILLLLAIVLSAALNPSISWLERRGVPRPAGVLSVFVLLIGITSIILITFVPIMLAQLEQLVVTLAHVTLTIVHRAGSSASVISAITNGISNVVAGITSQTTHIVGFISNGGFYVILGALLVYYLTVEHGNFRRFVSSLVPPKYQRLLLEAGNTIEHRLSLWLRGQLTLGLVIAILSGVGLLVLHVKYAFVLALLAGVLEMVPMLGAYVAMLPAAAIGFTMSPLTGVLVIVLYYVIQQLENNFIAPKVVSQAVGLKPMVVFLGLLLGAHLAGILGIILAVPGIILLEAFAKLVMDIRSLRARHA